MYKWFKNEQGMTLVELLAAISLLAIFLGIVSNVIMQLGNSENLTTGKMTLVEDTNVLISELRHQYDDQSNSQLCFDEDSKRLTIKSYTIINGNGAAEKLLHLKDGCIENIDKKLPVTIDLTTESSNGQTFSIQTAWEQHEEKNLNLKVIEEVEGDNGVGGDDSGDYQIYPDGGVLEGCILVLEGNTLFNKDIVKQYENGNGNGNGDGNTHICQIKVKNGHAKFNGKVEVMHDLIIDVAKNVYINGHLTLGNEEKIYAGQDLTIHDNATVTLHNFSKITVQGNANINGEIIQQGNSGSICVKGEVVKKEDYEDIFNCP